MLQVHLHCIPNIISELYEQLNVFLFGKFWAKFISTEAMKNGLFWFRLEKYQEKTQGYTIVLSATASAMVSYSTVRTIFSPLIKFHH